MVSPADAEVTRPGVLAPVAEVLVGAAGVIDLNGLHAVVRVLLLHHAVGAVGDGGAGHDADRLPGGDCPLRCHAGVEGPGDAERHGMLPVGGGHVLRPEGVSVHGGAVEGRLVDLRGEIRRRYPAQSLQ